MVRRVDLKGCLRAGQRLFGGFLNAASPVTAEVMALSGFDCLLIDREHGPGDLPSAQGQITAIRSAECGVLMRVPVNDPVELKRALDLGLDGVMVPAVSSVAEARAAAAACRYPPAGVRGVAPGIVRASGYGTDLAAYMASCEREFLLMCQIETREGLEAVEDIAAVDGVDMLFVGPYDLSANLGHLGRPDHPAIEAAMARVEAAAQKAGKLLGVIPTPGRGIAALFARGYHLVLGSADISLLRDAAQAEVAIARRALEAH